VQYKVGIEKEAFNNKNAVLALELRSMKYEKYGDFK